MNKKFLLSTIFTLMSWQGILAMDSNFSEAPEFSGKPKVSTTMQPQGPLVGNMIPDTMMGILKNLPFKDGSVLLSVNQFHRDHVEVWRSVAIFHSISTDEVMTTEELRKKIIDIEKGKYDLRTQVQSAPYVTPALMKSFLDRAQEKPFLWNTLNDALLEKIYPHAIDTGQEVLPKEAARGLGLFDRISDADRRAYLLALSLRKDLDETTPAGGAEIAQEMLSLAACQGNLGFTQDRGTPTSGYDYLVGISKRVNRDGTPGLGAEAAQRKLMNAAGSGRVGFTNDRGKPTSGHDYLVGISKSTNPDGSPIYCAWWAQRILIDAAHDGRLGFTKNRGKPTSGYDYLVWISERMNPDGTPGVGAEHAQDILNYAAHDGRLGFTPDRGTPTSGHDYLVGISKRVNHDGTPGVGARHAQKLLARFS